MSGTSHEQALKHGKALSEAVKAEHTDAVPGSDAAHAHSHGAHLAEEGKAHVMPETVGKQGREAGAMDNAPQDPKQTGRVNMRHG